MVRWSNEVFKVLCPIVVVALVVPVVLVVPGFPPLILYSAHETRANSRLRSRGGLPTRDLFAILINQTLLRLEQ